MTPASANPTNECVCCLIAADDQKTLHYVWNERALMSQMATSKSSCTSVEAEISGKRVTSWLWLSAADVNRIPAPPESPTSAEGKTPERLILHPSRLQEESQRGRLTVAFPAVAADGQAGDGVAGDAGGRGCDFHLDGASSLFIGLQRRAVERRLDGVSHLSKIHT